MPKRKPEDVAEEEEEEEEEEGGDGAGEDTSSSGEEEEDSDDSDAAPENEDGDEEDLDGEEGDKDDEIQVDFEFFDPKEADFLGLKALLINYLDGQDYANSELCDMIIQQSRVGTVVKTDADKDDPLGVISCFNVHAHRDKKVMQEIQAFMRSKCRDAATRGKLDRALASKRCGLVVSERLVNMPPQLATPLFQALMDEVAWATEDEPTEAGRDQFQIEQYLFLSRIYRDPAEPPGGAPLGKKRKGKEQDPLWVWVRPEDQYLHGVCEWCFTFDSHRGNTEASVAKDELQPVRIVMLVDARRIPEARAELERVLPVPQ